MICSLIDFTSGWPAYPDVEVRDINPDWEFLVIACDGIWDVMTNEVSLSLFKHSLAVTASYFLPPTLWLVTNKFAQKFKKLGLVSKSIKLLLSLIGVSKLLQQMCNDGTGKVVNTERVIKNVTVNLISWWLKTHNSGYGLPVKVSVKFVLDKAMNVPRESRGKVYFSALVGVGWSMLCPSYFTALKETQYLLYRRQGGGPRASVDGSDPQIVQPIVCHYTNCAIPVHCGLYVWQQRPVHILFDLQVCRECH